MIGRRNLTPWLWVAPALLFLVVFLIYPAGETIHVSFKSASSSEFVGVDNYTHIFTQSSTRIVLLNNLLWLVLFAGGCVALGLYQTVALLDAFQTMQ